VRILFDQGTPVPLRRWLREHSVVTAFEIGWSSLSNGDLLSRAEEQFDLLVTTDQNLRHQQNLVGRHLAILVLPTTSWPEIQGHESEVMLAVSRVLPGCYLELQWQAQPQSAERRAQGAGRGNSEAEN
jgi:hypothetical protein